MKRFLICVFVVLSVFSFVSCKKNKDNSKALTLKKDGELVIATSPDFPPFEYIDDRGAVVGIEIEILEKIALELGVGLKIQNVEFDSIIPGLMSNKFDLGVSGFSITEERKNNVLFAKPYTLAGQAIVVLEGSPITKREDLKGKKISAQSGTTADVYLQENGYDISAFSSNTEAQLALVSSKVDAWVIDNEVASSMVKKYNEQSSKTKLVVLDELLTYEEYAFIANKQNTQLINDINKILDKLKEDGTIERLFLKYEADYRRAN